EADRSAPLAPARRGPGRDDDSGGNCRDRRGHGEPPDELPHVWFSFRASLLPPRAPWHEVAVTARSDAARANRLGSRAQWRRGTAWSLLASCQEGRRPAVRSDALVREKLSRARESVREPRFELGDDAWVDRVADRRLAVEHVGAGGKQPVARTATELDRDHVVVRSVCDRDRWKRLRVVEVPALDDGDEARKRKHADRARPSHAESRREGHHR